MNKKLLGIALPVYNGADYLREALDSILNQDYQDFDIFISDNASTDETPQILAEYAKLDARVHYSRSPEFLKHADNVNRAVELCDTTWIRLFCHDDIMLPGCLNTTVRVINDSADERVALIGDAPGWLFGNGFRYTAYQNEESPPYRWDGRDFMRRKLRGQRVDPLPALTTATVRRAAFDSSPKFINKFMHFDVFLWSEMLVDWDYLFIPHMLTLTRIHGVQVQVDARKTLATVTDNQAFWPDYYERHRDVLQLTSRERYRIRLKPISIAGTIVAIQLIKGNVKAAAKLFTRFPVWWYPMLIVSISWALHREYSKVAALRTKVPVDLIYP